MPFDKQKITKPTAIIQSRPNVGAKWRDESRELPECTFERNESTLEAAIQWVKQSGNKARIYRIFQNKHRPEFIINSGL